uniref:Uncharacterized protein n=1 Tax=Steinernema glaseri TaxID=37863 RepID=A0A1I7ZJU0_9BILA
MLRTARAGNRRRQSADGEKTEGIHVRLRVRAGLPRSTAAAAETTPTDCLAAVVAIGSDAREKALPFRNNRPLPRKKNLSATSVHVGLRRPPRRTHTSARRAIAAADNDFPLSKVHS